MAAMAQGTTTGGGTAGTSTGDKTTGSSTGTSTKSSSSKSMSGKSSASSSESAFVKEAAQGGLAEVELGQLAVRRAKDEDVKQFAQRMVDDHSKANDELKQLASQKGWTLPTDVSSKQRADITRLTNASDASFDREYMHHMVMDHDHDVKAFQQYSAKGTDADLKAWAAKTLPTLQEHQQMAKSTSGKVGSGGSDHSKSGTTKTGQKTGTTSSTSSQGSNNGRKMPGQTGTEAGGTTTPRR